MKIGSGNPKIHAKIGIWRLIAGRGVVLVPLPINLNGAVDPVVFVLSQKAIAPHNIPFDEAVATDCQQHVAGACGTEVAPRAVDRGDDVLVEEDHFLCEAARPVSSGHWDGIQALGVFDKLAIFAPGLDVARHGR